MRGSQPATVVYLYGISAKSPADALSRGVRGVDGKANVEPLDCGEHVCWISHVPQDEFAVNLAKNMENLDWLSEAGVRHQRVVSAIAEVGDILPARFGTVFLDASSLIADLRKRRTVLRADLRKIRGCDEWGVKIFAVPPKIRIPAKKPSSGREYLKTKAALVRKPTAGIASEELEAFSTMLRGISGDMTEGGRISSGQRGLQWQSSLLVKRGSRKRFEAALKKYSKIWADSATIECTGPWPAYSFVSKG